VYPRKPWLQYRGAEREYILYIRYILSAHPRTSICKTTSSEKVSNLHKNNKQNKNKYQTKASKQELLNLLVLYICVFDGC
jgi:hypothetical protein